MNMLDLREQVFKEYRELSAKLITIDNECEDLHRQLYTLQTTRKKLNGELHNIKSVIDIMIIEDCDPVMAKLKFDENIAEMVNTLPSTIAEYYDNTKYAGHIPRLGIIDRLKRLIKG